MEYLIRLAQIHPSFRLAEIRSLATSFGIPLEILWYSPTSPFLLVRIHAAPSAGLSTPHAATEALISRSVLSAAIYELWGSTISVSLQKANGPAVEDQIVISPLTGSTSYESLHADIHTRTSLSQWTIYTNSTFKFRIDSFGTKRSPDTQREIINGFRYLGFTGAIVMDSPEEEFGVFEDWAPNPSDSHTANPSEPAALHFGRLVKTSPRLRLMEKHSLKTRPYISTTSMDPILAFVTANLALVGPGKVVYDPFMGTGGFLLAAAELGAVVWGSDIDGRSFRGQKEREGRKGFEGGVGKNLTKYELEHGVGDCFVADLVNTPVSRGKDHKGWLDAVLADPPYGVREGLKVLGRKEDFFPEGTEIRGELRMVDGLPAYLRPDYIAPKRPYSFTRMLDDILDFAAGVLVDEGRLAFWMPSANEEEGEASTLIPIPQNRALKLVECCEQPFNKWSRKLLVYQRRKRGESDQIGKAGSDIERDEGRGKTASELNPFRKKYFEKSKT